jgi:hypothetical protein
MTVASHGIHYLSLVFVSVFLSSFLGLMLQISLTRIFSTTIWYHYTFVAVSIALFGWGLGGIALHFLKERVQRSELDFLVVLLFILSVFLPICLLVYSWIPAYPSSIPIYFLVSLIPFFLAGSCLAFLYNRFTESASKLYFADLVGASVACLLADPGLSAFGPESIILFLGVLAAVSALLLSLLTRKRKLITLGLVGLLVLATVFCGNLENPFLNISNAPTKEMYTTLESNSNLKKVLTEWNSLSRIDVLEGYGGNVLATIYIDADASTEVIRWDGNVDSLQYMKQSMDILPYNLVNNPKTLVIGPGGGKDVLYALAGGSSQITAVELNPIIVEVVRDYGAKAGNIYSAVPNVSVCIDEGRSFVRRSSGRYDVITLTLVDSWAAISAGGYALAENYLYTKEAFMDYLNHLTDQGMLVMVRWQSEIPRLVSTFVEASRSFGEGAQGIGNRLAIVLNELEPGKVRALLIMKKLPFSQTEAENLATEVASLGSSYTAYYIPYVNDTIEPYHSLFNGSLTVGQFQSSFSYRVDAVTDDSPYYFNFEPGVPKILGQLLAFALLLSLGFVVFPLTVSHMKQWGKTGKKSRPSGNIVPFMVYFSMLGIGYMLLEIALMQKVILFLGYPTRALTVTLFSLLLASGVGSLISGRLAHDRKDLETNVLIACTLIIAIIVAYIFFLPVIISALLPESSFIRIIASGLLLFPLGFVMGIPFPSGLHVLGSESRQNVSWMWGVNGATSVFGSVFATLGGILYGFNYVLVFGTIAYFIALASVFWWKRAQVN